MQADDFNRFRAVMAGMAELYQRELSPILLDAYWLALQDWSLQEFEAAAGTLMRTSKFMPRPADWNEVRKLEWPTAAEAWLGYDGEDLDIRNVVDLCEQTVFGDLRRGLVQFAEMPWRQKRWIELYDELKETRQARVLTDPRMRLDQNGKRITGGLKQIGSVMSERKI